MEFWKRGLKLPCNNTTGWGDLLHRWPRQHD